MAALLDTRMPGVYTQEVPTLPPSVALVPTAVPVFIGYTEKAQKDGDDVSNKPVRIKSMRDYQDWFGGANNEKITVVADDRSSLGKPITVTIDKALSTGLTYRMYYALQLYFTNGGGPCYIISTGKYATPAAIAKQPLLDGITAAKKAKEITILVLPDAVKLADADYGQVITAALQHCQKNLNRVTIIDVKAVKDDGTPVDENQEVTDNFRSKMPSDINVKKYGAAYYPYLNTTLSYAFIEADVKVTLNTYATKPAVAPNPAPNPAPKPDPTDSTAEFTSKDTTLADLFSSNNLVYSKIKEAIGQFPVVMPPSAAVAGVYVANDFSQGVWKAPANVSLAGVVSTTIEIDDDFHADLNVDAGSGKSVNAIRPYTGKGILIFGARTLAGNDLEWRYISVRRTFCFIEDAVGQAMQDFVFAPNTRDTWIKVKAMIGNFLNEIWKAGGLFGNTPDEAYQVNVGEPETMSDLDILEGRMIVEIKLRVARPAEFIILRYEHKFQANNN